MRLTVRWCCVCRDDTARCGQNEDDARQQGVCEQLDACHFAAASLCLLVLRLLSANVPASVAKTKAGELYVGTWNSLMTIAKEEGAVALFHGERLTIAHPQSADCHADC